MKFLDHTFIVEDNFYNIFIPVTYGEVQGSLFTDWFRKRICAFRVLYWRG